MLLIQWNRLASTSRRFGITALVLVLSLGASFGATAGTVAGALNAREPAPPGWFRTIQLDRQTYAISEPKYWQANVSYLLIGTRRALLFDTGPGIYSIRAVVRSLTTLPVVVIPSHLHFDHVGDMEEFGDVRLLDTPALKTQVQDGVFVEPSAQYLLRTEKAFFVRGWIADGLPVTHDRTLPPLGSVTETLDLQDTDCVAAKQDQ